MAFLSSLQFKRHDAQSCYRGGGTPRISSKCESSSLRSVARHFGYLPLEDALLETSRHKQRNPDGMEEWTKQSLWWAARSGNEALCRHILQAYPIDTHRMGYMAGATALHMAAFWNNSPVIQLFNKENCIVQPFYTEDANGLSPLFWAVYRKNLSCISALLGAGFTFEAMSPWKVTNTVTAKYVLEGEKCTWFDWDCPDLELNLIKLKEQGISDDEAQFWKNLWLWQLSIQRDSRSNQDMEQIKLLLDNSANPNQYVFVTAPFHRCAMAGDEDLLNLFLERGTSVDIKDELGWTALKYTALTGQDNCASILLSEGAGFTDRTPEGTSHDVAVRYRSRSIAVMMTDI